MSGGGGGGPSTQTVNQSNLPEYARPYYEGLMDSSLVESGRPYVQYEGPRVAGFNDFQQGAFNQTANLQNPYGMGLANMYGGNAAAMGVDQMNRTGNWQAGQFGTNYAPGQFDYSRFIDPTNPEDYMSPYTRNVADIAKREATRSYDVQQTGRDAQAAKAGAYGGYRQAIENSEANRNLNQQLQDIDYKAQEGAYTNAQGQFNADRAARLQQQQAQEAANQFGGNLGVKLQEMGEQSRQFGGNLGLQGLQGASGMLGALSGLGSTDQQLALSRIGAMSAAGDTMQQQQQKGYDVSYNDFQNQQDWTRNQLNFYNSMLRGVPVSTSATPSQYQSSPNLYSQLGGAGLAALGAMKAT